jgi:hypothetical protein
MSEDFDPTEYARAPRLDVPSAIALAVKLTTSLPAAATVQMKDAAKAVEMKTTLLQTTWKERDREDKRVDIE